jgi:hypothetical protein
MVQDAVFRWNHVVPEELKPRFWDDFSLLETKLFIVARYSPDLTEYLKRAKYHEASPEIFMKLLNMVHEALYKMQSALINNHIVAMIDEVEDEDSLAISNEVSRTFSLSMQAQELFCSPQHSQSAELKLIDDALLCLARMSPDRRVAEIGTISVQNFKETFWVGEEEDEYVQKVSCFYNIDVIKSKKAKSLFILRPKMSVITRDVFINLFSEDIFDLTMHSLFRVVTDENSHGDLLRDTNLGGWSLLDKIAGSSITSLATISAHVASWMLAIYSEKKKLVLTESNMAEILSKPFYFVESPLSFAHLESVYKTLRNKCEVPNRAAKDFKTMYKLIQLYRSQVLLKPEILKQTRQLGSSKVSNQYPKLRIGWNDSDLLE